MPGMYTTPDEARSDLYLSGAVYLFGPLLVGLFLRIIPLQRLPLVDVLLTLVLPIATTVLVPFLLIRYRKEPWSAYGLNRDVGGALVGLLLAVPLIAATVLSGLVLGLADPFALLPLSNAVASPVRLVGVLAMWLGMAGLGAYLTVKARDAFRADYVSVREGLQTFGRIVVAVAGGAALLLLLGQFREGFSVEILLLILLPVLGLAGTLLLALRSLRGPTATSRAALLTPTVLFALGPLLPSLSFRATHLLEGIYLAALAAGIGLVVGAQQEARNSPWVAFGLAASIALFTVLGETLPL